MLVNIGLLLGTIVFFSGGIEVGLRVTGLVRIEPNPPRIFQEFDHPELRYVLKPNSSEKAYRSTVTTDSHGFRSREPDPQKPTIAVLGDSIAFGYGIEDDETIAARLAALLPDWNVVNAAAPGYGLRQQTALYQTKLVALKPRAIILVFHFNDLRDTGVPFLDAQGVLRPEGWIPSEKGCNPIEQGLLRLIPGRCWLDTHSVFYVAVKKFVTAQQGQRELKRQEKVSRENLLEDTVSEEQIETYAQFLDRFVQVLPIRTPKLFVIWPERYVHLISRPKLQSLAEARGFRVLDLYGVFDNRAETLPWDTVHPSAKTVAEAAKIISGALQHNGLMQ
jgi:lysophospholipase L1-like esterase